MIESGFDLEEGRRMCWMLVLWLAFLFRAYGNFHAATETNVSPRIQRISQASSAPVSKDAQYRRAAPSKRPNGLGSAMEIFVGGWKLNVRPFGTRCQREPLQDDGSPTWQPGPAAGGGKMPLQHIARAWAGPTPLSAYLRAHSHHPSSLKLGMTCSRRSRRWRTQPVGPVPSMELRVCPSSPARDA